MPQFKLSSGRELEVLDNGVDSTRAIVFHHGTPASASLWIQWFTFAADLGIRAISYSRAGYGTSDRDYGRSIVSVNKDISEVLASKGIERFVAIGWSGGGPHALANTLLETNVGAITLAGVGAYGVDDLDFLEGMAQENYDEFGASLQGEDVIQKWFVDNATVFKSAGGAEIREAFGGLISEADKKSMEGSFADVIASAIQSGLAVSFDGWVDDDVAFTKPWGFDLATITKPVKIWQGDQDFMVPHAHSHWLKKHISTAELTFIPGQGHVTLLVDYTDKVFAQAKELLA
jgi:pimeloyl-ACP methyl ester carboxylesterase